MNGTEMAKAQQDEANRLAYEESNRLALERQQAAIREEAEHARNAPQPVAVAAVQSKRTVVITATFAFEGISARVSNAGVEDFFKRQLPTKIAAILKSVESANELDC